MPPIPQRARNRPQPRDAHGHFIPGALPPIARPQQPRRRYQSKLNLNNRGEVQRRKILVAISSKRPRLNGHYLPGSVSSVHIPNRPQTRRQPKPNPAGHRHQDELRIINEKRKHYSNHPQVYQTNFMARLNPANREYNQYLKNHIL